MKVMGRHSPPVDGIPVANGHAPSLVPFTIPQLQVRQGGPVTPWPQPRKRDKAMTAVRHVTAHRGWLAAIPVILVNAVAFGAQLGFWRVHLRLPLEAVLVALALESIAIYLAWHAHLAQLADDSALRLRLAAYGMALLIGALNYSHFALPGWRPTVAAVTFGMMSAISPWLWSVHSRRASRDALKVKGLIEPHAVRLGATRWTWHLIRSWRVMFRATWQGENDPARAIALPAMKAPKVTADDGQDDAGEPVTEDVSVPSEPVPPSPPDDDVSPPSPPSPVPSKIRQKTTPAITKATAAIKRHPGLSDAEIAKRASVSESTVRRARTAIGAP